MNEASVTQAPPPTTLALTQLGAVRSPKKVYAAIAAVSADLAKIGISKSRSNAQQGYKFRGIDEVLNALAPILSLHGLVILPRILTRTVTERQTQKGGVLFSVVVEAEFDFVAASDGSVHVVRTFGEAMDSADKATNKAMSAAYKYAAFLAFCIPLEGTPDADATTPEVADPVPAGYEDFIVTFSESANHGLTALRQTFKLAQVAHREYLTKHDNDRYEQIKKRAGQVELPAEKVGA